MPDRLMKNTIRALEGWGLALPRRRPNDKSLKMLGRALEAELKRVTFLPSAKGSVGDQWLVALEVSRLERLLRLQAD